MRYLYSFIAADVKKKMVFLGGPRQVGKTTLAKEMLRSPPNTATNSVAHTAAAITVQVVILIGTSRQTAAR